MNRKNKRRSRKLGFDDNFEHFLSSDMTKASKKSRHLVFSLGFLEGQGGGGGGILTARSLEALIGKVIKISELKCVCLTYLYKGLARRNSYSSVSLSPPNISCFFVI